MRRQQDKDLMKSIPSGITVEVQRPWDGSMLGMLKGEKMATPTGAKLVRDEVRRGSSHNLTFSNFISDEMGSFWNEVVLQNVQSSHSWGWGGWGCLREVYGACTKVPNWKRACHVHEIERSAAQETTKWGWSHSVNCGKESGFGIWTFIWNAMEFKWLWMGKEWHLYLIYIWKKITLAVMWKKAKRKKAQREIRTC